MPALSWPRFQSWWKNSLKPTTAELFAWNSDDQQRKIIPRGSGGTRAACDAHKGLRVDLPPATSTPQAGGAHARGDSSLGEAVGRRRKRWGQAPVDSFTGFPPSCRKVSGAPSHLHPFFVKITPRKVPLSITTVGLWNLWNGHAWTGFPWGQYPHPGFSWPYRVTSTDRLVERGVC